MANILFRRKDVVNKGVTMAVSFETQDKRITVAAKPTWMHPLLFEENLKVFGQATNISLPADKMLALLSNELIIHEGWNLLLHTDEPGEDLQTTDLGRMHKAVEKALQRPYRKPGRDSAEIPA